jgi:hypothetical protein
MGMKIDKARKDSQSRAVNHLIRGAIESIPSDLRDHAVIDSDLLQCSIAR